MAVQKKTNAGEKEEKKETNWLQIGVIAFCVILVVMCVLSFANFQNFFGGNGTTGAVEAGYPVAVEYMMYVNETPISPFLTGFIAGYETNESLYLPLENLTKPYLIRADEQNAISMGVIGMNIGETKTVDGSGKQAYTYTKDSVKEMGLDFTKMEIGNMYQLDFPYTDELGEEATAMRFGVVTEKTDDKVTIQYGTDKIEIRFAGYLSTSA